MVADLKMHRKCPLLVCIVVHRSILLQWRETAMVKRTGNVSRCAQMCLMVHIPVAVGEDTRWTKQMALLVEV